MGVMIFIGQPGNDLSLKESAVLEEPVLLAEDEQLFRITLPVSTVAHRCDVGRSARRDRLHIEIHRPSPMTVSSACV